MRVDDAWTTDPLEKRQFSPRPLGKIRRFSLNPLEILLECNSWPTPYIKWNRPSIDALKDTSIGLHSIPVNSNPNP